jgi:predicted GNAT family acetyltransferase
MDAKPIEVKKNEFLRQFELKVNQKKLIRIEFSEQGKNTFLTRLIIDKSVEDNNYKDQFIRQVLELIIEEKRSVVPTCPLVASFFKENRAEFKHLLPAGINL